MTPEEKADILNGYDDLEELDKSHFDAIVKWVFDEDSYIRGQCAALLINFVNSETKDILFALAADEDDLVRTEAYDSLGVFAYDDVEMFLSKISAEEPDEVARSYAILSWADVAAALQKSPSGHIAKMMALKSQEKSSGCILSYCYALYLFGEKGALMEWLSFLNDDDYHVRCAAISLLENVVDETNKDVIKNSISKLLETESALSVRDKAARFLKENRSEPSDSDFSM